MCNSTINLPLQTAFLVQQYKTTVQLQGLAEGILQILQDLQVDPLCEFQGQLNINNAHGSWLDRIGAIFNYPRISVPSDNIIYFGFEGNGVGFDQLPFDPFQGPNTTFVPVADDLYRILLLAWISGLFGDGTVPSISQIIKNAFGNGYVIDNGDMSAWVILFLTRIDDLTAIINSGVIFKPAAVKYYYQSNPATSFGFEGNSVGFDQAPFVFTDFEV